MNFTMLDDIYNVLKQEANMPAADGGIRHDYLMQFFSYEHLKPELQEISKPFGELALTVMQLPSNAERTMALRKLLEAKDCAVRASMMK